MVTPLIGTSYTSECVSKCKPILCPSYRPLRVLQGFVTRGAGAVTMEASAVVPEGRISPEDLVSELMLVGSSTYLNALVSGNLDRFTYRAVEAHRQLCTWPRYPHWDSTRACRPQGFYISHLGS